LITVKKSGIPPPEGAVGYTSPINSI
jgi:hypothetical protein